MTRPGPTANQGILPVAILLWLSGLYLRIPVLVAPPLAPFIADELALSRALTGALTTLPVLMLAIGAMPGALAISRMGPRNTLALALIIMALGSAGRGLSPDVTTLMACSAVMGFGVAMMQPSLPALLPRWLEPSKIALGTAIYMNGMLMGEFIGAGITLPVIMPVLNDDWRLTLLAWSLPGLLVAACLYLPHRDFNRPRFRPAWLPDLRNPLTLKLGLLLGGSASMFFGVNAYMANLLEHRGELASLDSALFFFNIAQVGASLIMLAMARRWTGRKRPILVVVIASALAMAASLVTHGWLSIAMATLMSFFAGIQLILLVALPPLVTDSEETGRVAAGVFLVGYTLSFAVPMVGGVIADMTDNIYFALGAILLYGCIAIPLAMNLTIRHPSQDPDSTGDKDAH